MAQPAPPPSSIPLRTSLLLPLTQTPALLSSLLASLPGSPNAVPQTHAAFLSTQHALASLDAAARAHQAAWARVRAREDEVDGLERRVRGMLRALEQGRRELEALVVVGREDLREIERAEKHPAPVTALLAHAHALAATTSAPPAPTIADAARAPAAPWPSEAAMRTGLLFALEGSMSGTGDVGQVGDEPAPKPARHVDVVEEHAARFDPHAVFELDLNTDESDADD
ncbi:hypothetical protein Q5752_003880 [Cryptotrichosporon argae]